MTKRLDDDRQELVEWQRGVCAICRRRFTRLRYPVLDHDHASGEERGALCNRCNGLLGMVGEDVALLENMVEYLIDPPSRECWTEPRFWPGSPGAEGITTNPTEEVEIP